MYYAIVINLDYDTHSAESCKELWNVIRDHMLASGFRCDGRTFTIEAREEEATNLARKVIDDIESHMDYHNKRIFLYLKEFYGFDMACTTNLLLPPDNAIKLN